MPYVEKTFRASIDPEIDLVLGKLRMFSWDERVGLLNYVITRLLLGLAPQRYHHFNALMGVLEACKHEFYRRLVGIYEDRKAEQNGDVY